MDRQDNSGQEQFQPFADTDPFPGGLVAQAGARSTRAQRRSLRSVADLVLPPWLKYILTRSNLLQPGTRVRFTRKITMPRAVDADGENMRHGITIEPGTSCEIWGYMNSQYLVRLLSKDTELKAPQSWVPWHDPSTWVILLKTTTLVFVPEGSFDILIG